MATEKIEKTEKETKAEQQPEVKGTKPNLKDGIVFKLQRSKNEGSEYWNYFIPVLNDKGVERGRVKISTKDEDKRQFYDLLDLMFDESGDNVSFMVKTVTIPGDKATGRKASEYTEYSVFTVDDYGEIDSVGVTVPGKANKSLLDRLIRQALRG